LFRQKNKSWINKFNSSIITLPLSPKSTKVYSCIYLYYM
jgi:hypothetical protein